MHSTRCNSGKAGTLVPAARDRGLPIWRLISRTLVCVAHCRVPPTALALSLAAGGVPTCQRTARQKFMIL